MEKYAIVEFTADKSVEAVPLSWTNEEMTQSYWPAQWSMDKIGKAIAKNQKPDEKTWTLLPIRLLAIKSKRIMCNASKQ